MRGRPGGLDAAALVYGNVHHNGAVLHARHHIPGDELGRFRPVHEHGPDDHVRFRHVGGGPRPVRDDQVHPAPENVREVREPLGVDVKNPHYGAHPHRDLGGLHAHHAAADDRDLRSRGPRHAAKEQTRPALRALQATGRRLRGHPAGDLAHRGEQGQAPVRELDRLIGYGVDLALHEELGELLVRRKMQVREELVSLSEAVVLLRYGLLDLHDQIRRLEDLLRPLDQPRPSLLVLLVRETSAPTSTRLHNHLVSVVDQLRHPVRLHGNAAFLVFDLLRNTHDSSHALSSSLLPPPYLISGYYKLATILSTAFAAGAAVAATLQVYCEVDIWTANETGGLLALGGGSVGFSIGEVSQAIGLAPQTLRLWERERLIKPRRTDRGYRIYAEIDVERLRR